MNEMGYAFEMTSLACYVSACLNSVFDPRDHCRNVSAITSVNVVYYRPPQTFYKIKYIQCY